MQQKQPSLLSTQVPTQGTRKVEQSYAPSLQWRQPRRKAHNKQHTQHVHVSSCFRHNELDFAVASEAVERGAATKEGRARAVGAKG